MKKLIYLIVLALILGLVLTGCLLSNVGQVPATEQIGVNSITKSLTGNICIDFENIGNEGDLVEGFFIDGLLKIELDSINTKKELVLVKEGTTNLSYLVYSANKVSQNDTPNGCLDGYGFGALAGVPTRLEPGDEIVFTFPAGVTVSHFSVDMFDYGDWYPVGSDTPKVVLTGDTGGTSVYEFPGSPNRTIYDACEGSDGIETLVINGAGITEVTLSFEGKMDPGVAFDNICFTPETNVCSTDLIAGQDFDNPVGDVKVEYTPGDEFITVTYNTNEPWLMEEIHFHASFDPPESWGKPVVNKAGNPAPGHFLKVFEGLGESNSESFIIPLSEIDGGVCGALYFAAHAEVRNVIDEFIVSEADSSMVYAYEEDTGNLGYPSSTLYKSGSAVEALYPSWPGISGAKWISLGDWLETTPDGDLDNHQEGWWGDYINSWWKFERTINIPLNAVNISGTLNITSDNVESIELNSIGVGGYTDVYGAFSDSQQWKKINSHSISLSPGPNDLNIMVRNFLRPEGTGYDNPIGLIYKLEYQYQIEETAWGAGDGFSGKNWAMYFICDQLLPSCEE